MKTFFRLNWLGLAVFLFATEGRADTTLNPIDGLTQTSIYGVADFGDGPPGLLGQYYDHTTDVQVYNDIDPRMGVGTDVSQLLLYDLHPILGSPVVDTQLNLTFGSVLCNFSSDPYFSVTLEISLLGANHSVLDGSDFANAGFLFTSIDIPAGDYNGGLTMHVNITSGLQGLLDAGYQFSAISFRTFDTTIYGPSVISLASAPPISVVGASITRFSPFVAFVPEPSSMVSLGIALACMAGFGAARSPWKRG